MLDAVEAGDIGLHELVQVTRSSAVRPVRRLLRELVWTGYARGGVDAAPPEEVEAPFRTAFEHAPVAMAMSDLAGRLTHVNAAMAALLGRSGVSMLGLAVGALSEPGDRAAELAMGAEMFAGKRAWFTVEKQFLHADGRKVPCALSLALVRAADGQPERVVATILDLRDRLELEQRRRDAVELSAVQRVASGVAHDLNNLLTVIRVTTDTLREDAVAADEDLAAMDQAARVATALTRQLQQLARPTADAAEPLQLADQIRLLEPMLRRLLPVGVRLSLHLDASQTVVMDRADLEQILLNLVVNAGQHTPPDKEVRVRLSTDDALGCVVLVVEDEGVGMPPEVKARVLEPFFSRRPGGTGLGLAVVNAAANRAGATLQIESEPGHGSAFRLAFRPMAVGAPSGGDASAVARA